MQIETRFDIGQEVWMRFGGGSDIQAATVKQISFISTPAGDSIFYIVEMSSYKAELDKFESELFSSHAEALKAQEGK